MKEGPDISRLGALIGDPARANILTALLAGRALTASELANEAGVTAQTASGHLKLMEDAGLLWRRRQGRHHYFALAGDEVGYMLESLLGFAAGMGHLRTRTGPRDDAMREARVCYDHLAGAAGVRMFDSLVTTGAIRAEREDLRLTDAGRGQIAVLGIDPASVDTSKRPVCRACLDWSERRTHLAGALGAALLDRIYDLKWANRAPEGRAVLFTSKGRTAFEAAFPLG
ncbi:ArsR/SmtB family transcription factor [Maritimibacter dapengensis]|uniref:Helix-turn-helix domain-containing protein n=1 Tax=Maritimibacter dapengensis TaxID=2836868 RepID=A0ABS6T3R2_9RHOB|nr:helix-turn-helix domain-containing protein [Maritimibacter dapengensis]MBV7379896.1 helix-turn-helix domain-containing protein [Maritimibacter dapengensis]